MAQIISFSKAHSRAGQKDDAKRLKALVHNKIHVYTCDTCDMDFEVIDEEYPEKCPNCGRKIVEWNKEED